MLSFHLLGTARRRFEYFVKKKAVMSSYPLLAFGRREEKGFLFVCLIRVRALRICELLMARTPSIGLKDVRDYDSWSLTLARLGSESIQAYLCTLQITFS